MKELFTALAEFQGEVENIELNSTVSVKTAGGGSYNFDYATLGQILSTIRPILKKHGLSFTQLMHEGKMATWIRHSSGQELMSSIQLPPLTKFNKEGVEVSMTAQEIGSVITYFRRYGLVTAFGLVAEDDEDGNIATGNTVERKETKPKGLILPDGRELIKGVKNGRTWYGVKDKDAKIEWLKEEQYQELLGKVPKPELINPAF